MYKHLYRLQRPCPRTVINMELTNEIKEHVMNYRVYLPPRQVNTQTNNINQIINNFNTVNNFINSIDMMKKLNAYTTFNNIELIDYKDNVEQTFLIRKRNFDKDKFTMNTGLYTKDDLYERLDEVSTVVNGDFTKYNIHFDDKANKVRMYESGEWESFLIDSGVKKAIQIIQEYFFDAYESFLVRKLYSDDIGPRDKQIIEEQIKEYYKFISCFDLFPTVKDKSDNIILGFNERNFRQSSFDDAISERLMKWYNTIENNMMRSEYNKIRKDVIEILKRNTKHNMDELNKRMTSLFNMDEEFKKSLLECIK